MLKKLGLSLAYFQDISLNVILSRTLCHWNSTYYMLSFAFKYCAAINAMTAVNALKLWKFELEDEEWLIVEDLVAILLVTTFIYHLLQD